MKEYSLSLDVISAEANLQDLTSQLGATPSESSHDLGSPRVRQGLWEETVWRLESEVTVSASLEEHFNNLFAKAHESGVLEASRGIKNAKKFLNLGVFFDSPMCTVGIPQSCLNAIKDYSLGLEITCYPSEADE